MRFSFFNESLQKKFRTVSLAILLSFILLFSQNCSKTNSAIKRLDSEDLKARSKAIETLVEIGQPAVKPLLELLKDNNSLKRIGAIIALGKIGDKRAVEPLISLLNDSDISVREAAIRALGNIKDSAAVKPIIKLLTTEDAKICQSAIEALGEIKDSAAIEPLMNLFNGKESSIQTMAIKAAVLDAIAKFGFNAVGPLINKLKKDNESISWIELTLKKIGTPAVEPLIEALEFEYESTPETALGNMVDESIIRMKIAGVLAGIKDSRAVLPLIKALKTEINTFLELNFVMEAPLDIIKAICYSLWQQGPPAVNPVIGLLENKGRDPKDRILRHLAIEILGNLKDDRAVEPILQYGLKSELAPMRKVAAESLKKITGQDFGLSLSKWENWWNNNKKNSTGQ